MDKKQPEKKFGTREWSGYSVNIASGCSHNCRYCYAKYNGVKRFGTVAEGKWPDMKVRQRAVDKDYPKYDDTVMFPTTHDITPAIINEYLCVLHKLLDKGNRVLIVTKPHLTSVRLICESCRAQKGRILFRFTIGSVNNAVLKFFEPGAPAFEERFDSLRYAFREDYATSVSIEPYLDPWVTDTFNILKDYVTETIWIGKLNGWEKRMDLTGASHGEITLYHDRLKAAQCDAFVKATYNCLKKEKKVRWKDSIREVLEG